MLRFIFIVSFIRLYGVGFHQSVIIISLIGCDVFFVHLRDTRSSFFFFIPLKICCCNFCTALSTVIVSHFDRFVDEMKWNDSVDVNDLKLLIYVNRHEFCTHFFYRLPKTIYTHRVCVRPREKERERKHLQLIFNLV